MKNIEESIINYLKMKHTGALLISGKWGSGKTFYVKTQLFPKIKSENGLTPIMVSLYGVESRAEIARKIIYGFLDVKSNSGKGMVTKAAEWLTTASKYIPKLNEYVDLSKLVDGSAENLMKFFPINEEVLFLDDLERLSPNLEIKDVLALVNDLVENFGTKVVLIANKDKISEDDLRFKEKTIEKELEFRTDLAQIFDSVSSNYKDAEFGKYLVENRDFFVKSLLERTGDESTDESLSESLSNIRTLKFALEHFKQIIEVNFNVGKLSDLEEMQVKNIWVFVLSISAEFRTNNLSLRDKKGIDTASNSLIFKEFSFSEDDSFERGKKSYLQEFKEKYYSRLGDKYIFYPEIYDFVLGGFPIDSVEFAKTLNKEFHLESGEIKECYRAFNEVFGTRTKMNSDEFISKLSSLISFAENGDFESPLDYINVAAIAFEYSDFIGNSKKELKKKIGEGLKIGMNRSEFVERNKISLGMISDDNQVPELKELVKIALEALQERTIQLDKQEIDEIITLFKSDFSEFVSQFTDESSVGDGKYVYRSYLDRLSDVEVETFVKNIKWEETWMLQQLIDSRYLRSHNVYNYSKEEIFLKKLEERITSFCEEDSGITSHELRIKILPRIKKAILRFQSPRISK